MGSVLLMAILLNPEKTDLHTAIGQAVEAYAKVEGAQSMVLERLLNISSHEATVIFFSIQNVRTRNEAFQTLLTIKHKEKYTKFWKKVASFLSTLSKFRNGVVHWAPAVVLYRSKEGKTVKHEHELMHPAYNSKFDLIDRTKIDNFVKDCRYIEQEIHALKRELDGDPPERASPHRFLRPSIRPNLAFLQPPPTPKARQPRRPPSVPKLSAAQRRAKALKDARAKKS